MLNVIMVSVFLIVMLSVLMLNVVILSVVAPEVLLLLTFFVAVKMQKYRKQKKKYFNEKFIQN
jgi:hypothetical protein